MRAMADSLAGFHEVACTQATLDVSITAIFDVGVLSARQWNDARFHIPIDL